MITLICIVVFSLEAFAMANVISASMVFEGVYTEHQHQKRHLHNRWWHRWFAAMWMVAGLCIWLYAGTWWHLVAMGAARLWVLQVVLNLARGLPVTHLGQYGIDGWMVRVFGNAPEVGLWIILLLKTLLLAGVLFREFLN